MLGGLKGRNLMGWGNCIIEDCSMRESGKTGRDKVQGRNIILHEAIGIMVPFLMVLNPYKEFTTQ